VAFTASARISSGFLTFGAAGGLVLVDVLVLVLVDVLVAAGAGGGLDAHPAPRRRQTADTSRRIPEC
jgi:hypothetical protein